MLPSGRTIFECRKFSTYVTSVQNQTDFLCQLVMLYLFSVAISTFVCFYSMAD